MTTLASLLSKEEQQHQAGCHFRLYPTKDQQEHLAKTFGCCRFVYNQALASTTATYQQHKLNPNTPKPQVSPIGLASPSTYNYRVLTV